MNKMQIIHISNNQTNKRNNLFRSIIKSNKIVDLILGLYAFAFTIALHYNN